MADEDFFPEYQNAELLWDVEEPKCFDLLDSSVEDNEPQRMDQIPVLENKTPLKLDGSCTSSPQFLTPQAKELILPFSTCNESPIDRCAIAASTPFQGQRISSTSSDITKSVHLHNNAGNTTFGIDKQMTSRADATFDINESRRAEGTFIKEGRNLTFTTEERNVTFDKKPSEKDSGSDVMESCTQLESSTESAGSEKNPQTGFRKPLRTIPQTRIAQASKDGTKRSSRLGQPRMNTAALSRIQARSPQPKNAGPAPTNNNSSSARSLKKPSATTSNGKVRKSLLPPSVSTTKKTWKGMQTRPDSAKEQNSENINLGTSGTPTKRKAPESPKRGAPKIGTRTSVPTRLSGLPGRSSSVPASRLPNTAARSRLQRPSGLKGPSSSARSTGSINKPTGSSGSLIAPAKTSAKSQQESHSTSNVHDSLTSEGNLRQPVQPVKKPEIPHEVRCMTAVATLLDYVVNRVDGLSAPRLSGEVQRLRKIIDEKEQLNCDLSSQLSELQEKLSATIQKYEQDVLEERKAKNEFQEQIMDLLSELENERQKRREVVMENDLKMEEITNKHAEELNEWSQKYEELERTMENNIKEELEERIKPYVNSVSEVKSLTAVLEIKNESIHQLQNQCASNSIHREEVDVLNHKYEQLKQKNEDLTMRLQDRTNETRNLSEECHKLQRSFSEEQSRSTRLSQLNEELKFRLESVSPLSPSFNPVFTPSPVPSEESPFDETPRTSSLRPKRNRSNGEPNDKWPKSLVYRNDERPEKELDNAL